MAIITTIQTRQTRDTLLLPIPQNDSLSDFLADFAIKNGLNAAALQQDFKADAKEVLLCYLPGKKLKRVFLIGMGKKIGFSEVQSALRSFCFRNKSRLAQNISLDMQHLEYPSPEYLTEAAVAGMILGLYQTKPDKIADGKPAPQFGDGASSLEILVPSRMAKIHDAAAQRGAVIAEVQTKIMALMNAPSNQKTPEVFAEMIQRAGKEMGFSTKILLRDAIIKEGLTALLSVSEGSPNTPAFIILEYLPKNLKQKPVQKIGLVGKGVTFDTGGISIKPSTNLHLMKSDMGGGAAVFGTFMAAARLQLPLHLIGVIPATENMTDGKSTKPGDIIPTYAGKTIEVIDTDAEGRIILADALAWITKNKKPDVLIDLATLTGSVVRALGPYAAGIFSQNDSLVQKLVGAGARCGEKLWQLPLWNEYATDLKSDVADLKNYTGKLYSDASAAAKFLENFTNEHPNWAHLDIAGVVFHDSEFAANRSASGYGVRLLIEYLTSL